MLVGVAARPALSCTGACCWADTILQNTTISGLIRDGESKRIDFLGEGNWTLDGTMPVCVYALWRIHGRGEDMQAYIELARKGDGEYWMEIYHSWTTLSVDVPSEYEGTPFVIYETPHLLVLNITADLEC